MNPTRRPPAQDEANTAQRQAADPAASAFVLASAGSGKTKLLIDRLLRLLLAGAAPERLLCLTYTRAAAAEMALRLRERLGRWVMADEAELERDLEALGVASGEEMRRRARTLFAELLDVPGGLRIDTIHAFCQSVLRRFPLEAGLSPHFTVIEEGERAELVAKALEEVLAQAVEGRGEERARLSQAIARLSVRCEKRDVIEAIGLVLDGLRRYRAILERPAELRRRILMERLGLEICDEESFWRCVFDLPPDLAATLRRLAADASPSVKEKLECLSDWLEKDERERRECFDEKWCDVLLTKKKEPREKLLNSKLKKLYPGDAEVLRKVQEKLARSVLHYEALGDVELALAFLDLAAPVIARFEEEKKRAGFLDFSDLIERTAALLCSYPAAFVLYKLDGGIDHILVDEAQDTAPEQWEIIEALSEEFFAGETARPANRTLFVVGDVKQSIYSFQGARPEMLLPRRREWREKAEACGALWREVPLNVSFRATAPLLALVDAVFQGKAAALGLPEGEAITHVSAREERGARIDLWPLLCRSEKEAASVPPRDEPPSLEAALAQEVALWIATLLSGAGGVRLPASGRRVEARDILVLVRRRGPFDAHLVRALKKRGVKVAGRDRLLLTEQPAVADVLNLCDVILLPEDDFALAAFLLSPLGGLDQESLMHLALNRSDGLWQTLLRRQGERKEWKAAADYLKTLLDRHDFVSPYGLLAEALHALGGRARLLGRFGEEALEPLAELLTEARRFSETHTPSLQGFLHWIRMSGEEIKRAPENLADAVRIMTVHGAKGLQAPLVILPDTTFSAERLGPARDAVWGLPGQEGEFPFYHRRALPFAGAYGEARAKKEEEARAEHHRLLYVALTRAEEWLLVCGVGKNAKPKAEEKEAVEKEAGEKEPEERASPSWYTLIAQGLKALPGLSEEDPSPPSAPGLAWAGKTLSLVQEGARPTLAPPSSPPAPPPPRFLEDPRRFPPPAEPLPPRLTPAASASPLSPLRAPSSARLAALTRGEAIHALLAQGPKQGGGAEAMAQVLRRCGIGESEAHGIAQKLCTLFTAPDYAPFFDPRARAEVPVAGRVAGFEVVGTIDRLLITEETVWLADFKTDADPPLRPPAAYLRQLALYWALLRDLHPGRAVRAALVWTALPRLDWIGEEELCRHLPAREA